MKGGTYPRQGLHGALVHDIGVRILSGELEPGDALPTEAELTGEVAASRTVLREAVKVLAAKRLVQSRPKTGTRVRPRSEWNLLDPDVLAWQLEAGPPRAFLQDALELRQLIEPAAARLAADRATDTEIAALQEAFTAMSEARNLEAWIEPDVRFHSILLQAAHNELLEHLLSIVTAVLRMLFAFSSRPPRTFTRALPLHEAIIDAVRSHDPDAAEAAALRLLEDTDKNIKRALREEARHHPSPAADGRRGRRARPRA
ncbi:MAG TPA: FadR/GntR family transcriptional regulator [Gaiellaceae bacterium]